METTDQKFTELGEKERKQYNEGLKRDGCDRFFSHCRYYYIQKGKILFVEPLCMNPFGRLVRSITRKARTEDEQPLRVCGIAEMKKRFSTHFFMKSFCRCLLELSLVCYLKIGRTL